MRMPGGAVKYTLVRKAVKSLLFIFENEVSGNITKLLS